MLPSHPCRWLPLKGSASYASDQACKENASTLATLGASLARHPGPDGRAFPSCGGATTLAPHLLPCLRILSRYLTHAWLLAVMPGEWSQFWNGGVTRTVEGGGGGWGGRQQGQAAGGKELSQYLEGAGPGEGGDAGDAIESSD